MSSKKQIPVALKSRLQPKKKIDLRVDGIPQEAILNDEIQMKDIKDTLQKLQISSQVQSIRNDLNKEGKIF